MPQLWFTYEEYALLTGCSLEMVREMVGFEAWDRRRSRDGQTRIKVPPSRMADSLQRLTRVCADAPAGSPLVGPDAADWLRQRLQNAGMTVRAATPDDDGASRDTVPATPITKVA
ncbi:MAG: hypothetical protein HC900_12035 [Methylacidiphilales bacterium]|nr:hypothetical protein [Candidatus Methylacidiphilales bacterium]